MWLAVPYLESRILLVSQRLVLLESLVGHVLCFNQSLVLQLESRNCCHVAAQELLAGNRRLLGPLDHLHPPRMCACRCTSISIKHARETEKSLDGCTPNTRYKIVLAWFYLQFIGQALADVCNQCRHTLLHSGSGRLGDILVGQKWGKHKICLRFNVSQ